MSNLRNRSNQVKNQKRINKNLEIIKEIEKKNKESQIKSQK